MVKTVKKGISKKQKNKNIITYSNNVINGEVKDNMNQNRSFYYPIITFILLFVVSVLYYRLYKLSSELNLLKSEISVLQSIDLSSYKEMIDKQSSLIHEIDKDVKSTISKYEDEISVLREKIKIFDNKQKLYTGSNFILLTMLNNLKLRIDTNVTFNNELEIIKSLDLSDKHILDFIKFVSVYSSTGIPTLNQLQKDYQNLIMNAIFAQDNSMWNDKNFMYKLLYRVKSLIKIRKIKDTDSETVDSVLQKISVELENGNLEHVADLLKTVKDKYHAAFVVLEKFDSDFGIRYRFESNLSSIINNLLIDSHKMKYNKL